MKVTFGLKVLFSREVEKKGKRLEMSHYFYEDEPHIFQRHDDEEKILQEFDKFIENINGKIEN